MSYFKQLRHEPECDSSVCATCGSYRYSASGDVCFCGSEDRKPCNCERGVTLARVEALEDALSDMLAGWQYIRNVHGDLYGVGWDRAENKARKALEVTE